MSDFDFNNVANLSKCKVLLGNERIFHSYQKMTKVS